MQRVGEPTILPRAGLIFNTALDPLLCTTSRRCESCSASRYAKYRTAVRCNMRSPRLRVLGNHGTQCAIVAAPVGCLVRRLCGAK
jgi:hypothetical protein